MDSNRSGGHVDVLMPCQVEDPARGSFMVHPVAVKLSNGNMKTIPGPYGTRLSVFRAANHITPTMKGVKVEPHPEAFDYAVDYSKW